MPGEEKIKIVAINRKAGHEYHVEDRFEAGLVLKGSEIKSIRDGAVSFSDSFVDLLEGELWLVGFKIADYSKASCFGHAPMRNRKLLLKKDEIRKISRRIEEKGYTAVPLKLYLKDGLAKMEIGLAKGRTRVDKRDAIRKKDEDKQLRRDLKERNR